MEPSQSTHRQTFIDVLAEDIRKRLTEESESFASAAVRVVLTWLGYDIDAVNFIDSQDRGVDAWVSTGQGFDIFQVKTHEPDEYGLLNLQPFDGRGVSDLERAKNFFLYEHNPSVTRKELKQLLLQRDSALRSYRLEGNTVALPVTLHLITLGNGLTAQANAEFRTFQSDNAMGTSLDEVPIQIHAVIHTIDDIINEKWREKNRDWSDSRGKRYDRISLRPPGNEGFISDNANAIFYCKAIDLVTAYDTLGYQIFEPNVRANITKSRVNQAIRDSVLHQRSRRDFRFLNNGVTITCDSFTKPNQQKPHFNVIHPGIVNGLQTVVALHTAYQQLSNRDKEDFENNCSVLVRLLKNDAVDDITRVVQATNNQNPMKPRNLVSNNPEQLVFARFFAEELNWFYEAKEGAWDAFENDPKRWRPYLNKKPKDFRPVNRRKVRKIDNSDLAQTWLAFIGFSSEAVNEKKLLFEERFYSLIFKQQTRQHGVDYDFVLAKAREDSLDYSPNAALLLVAYLAQTFAGEIVPTASQNRHEALLRLGVPENKIKQKQVELDVQLSKDNLFLLNQVLAGTSVLFTEFIGFVLYRAFGENIHRYGLQILRNFSFASLADHFNVETIKEQIDNNSFNERDLLVVLWLVFVETIEDLTNTGWGESYRAAPVKVRFIFSRETRERLYREIQNTNEYMKKRSLKKPWAIGVAEGQGLFDFVRSCIQ